MLCLASFWTMILHTHLSTKVCSILICYGERQSFNVETVKLEALHPSQEERIFERIKAILYSLNCLKDYNCAVQCVRRLLKYLFKNHILFICRIQGDLKYLWSDVRWSLIALLVICPTKTHLKLCRYQSLNPDNLVYYSLIFTLCSWHYKQLSSYLSTTLQLMRKIKD